jgi:cell division protein FtsN
MQLMMKITLIKFGLVCLISTVVLSACVKKEQPEQEQSNNDTEVQNNEQAETTLQEQPQPQYTTLEEIPSEPTASSHASISDDQQTLIYNENGQSDLKTATTTTPTQPNVESKPSSSVPATSASNNTSNATPAKAATVNNEEAASEDDAIATAMKAAQPAL